MRIGSILRLGCGLLLLAMLVAGSTYAMIVRPMPARAAADAFLADVRARDWATALRRTSATYQGQHDAASLERAIEAIPPLAHHESATFVNASFEGDRALLDGTISGPDGEAPIAIELIDLNDNWYLDLVVVEGTPLE